MRVAVYVEETRRSAIGEGVKKVPSWGFPRASITKLESSRGDVMVAPITNGVLQYVPVKAVRDTRAIIRGLSSNRPRDEGRPRVSSIDSSAGT